MLIRQLPTLVKWGWWKIYWPRSNIDYRPRHRDIGSDWIECQFDWHIWVQIYI